MFTGRQADLEGSFARMAGKMNWVNENRASLELGDEQLHGAVVSSFIEEATVPPNVVMTTIADLDSIFGKSKYKTFHELSYEFSKKSEGVAPFNADQVACV